MPDTYKDGEEYDHKLASYGYCTKGHGWDQFYDGRCERCEKQARVRKEYEI